jgi:DNA-binding NarL/FixJ family response regulator
MNASLSPRQQQVLILVAQGCTNREIARRLDISSYTVGEYLTAVFDKLGVVDRASAAMKAYRCGLIKFDTQTVH